MGVCGCRCGCGECRCVVWVWVFLSACAAFMACWFCFLLRIGFFSNHSLPDVQSVHIKMEDNRRRLRLLGGKQGNSYGNRTAVRFF